MERSFSHKLKSLRISKHKAKDLEVKHLNLSDLNLGKVLIRSKFVKIITSKSPKNHFLSSLEKNKGWWVMSILTSVVVGLFCFAFVFVVLFALYFMVVLLSQVFKLSTEKKTLIEDNKIVEKTRNCSN